jgi:hypothetical protein
VPAVQDSSTHVAPFAYFWHAPWPSQNPFEPHDAAPWSEHSVSGSLPAAKFVQAPTAPVALHDWQVPLQRALQQTPSVQ